MSRTAFALVSPRPNRRKQTTTAVAFRQGSLSGGGLHVTESVGAAVDFTLGSGASFVDETFTPREFDSPRSTPRGATPRDMTETWYGC